VDMADVQAGTNTVQFKSTDAMAIANIDLVLQGAGGTVGTDEIFGNGFD
jgi:hypothetical protein